MVAVGDLAERGTIDFYRDQVARLVRLSETLTDSAARLELLEVAAIFQRLADRAAATVAALRDASASTSA
ncbi:MAG TPA: hypothetical protein VHY80_04190 [Stellaceae bacterium]|jgi:hypothetical protein|nr:hypothetical protein [Stellaceae bacterium]